MNWDPQAGLREQTGERMNLLFCINRNFLSLLETCLRSVVIRGGYHGYEAYVLHSDLDEQALEPLRITFQEQVRFHLIRVPEDMFDGFPESRRYPKQIYYRLAAPLLLPRELERILYLDVDTVVINPLGELYETDFEGSYYVGCTHTRELLTKLNQTRLCSQKAVAYINTGVLLLNLPELRENVRLEQICAYTRERKMALILPDQDILSALYADKVKLADTMRFNLSDRILGLYNADPTNEKRNLDWVRQNAVIIHYCGKNKPWKARYTGVLGEFYWQQLPQRETGNGEASDSIGKS